MALISCKECGNQVSNKAETCPGCGFRLKEPKKQPNSFESCLGCVGVFIAIFVFLIIISLLGAM